MCIRDRDNNDEHKLKQKELNEKAYGELEKCGKKFENIILSDEQIWYRCNYEEKFWERLKEDFGKIDCKVKVVVYLRPVSYTHLGLRQATGEIMIQFPLRCVILMKRENLKRKPIAL